MVEATTPRDSPTTDAATTSLRAQSPIVLSEAWKQLHLTSPSHTFATPPRNNHAKADGDRNASSHKPSNDDDADSSDDGALSDHSEDLHPRPASTLSSQQHEEQGSIQAPLCSYPKQARQPPLPHQQCQHLDRLCVIEPQC